MGEQQNLAAARRLYQLMNDGDLPAVLEMVDDDVELFLFGSAKVPWAGHWRGRRGVEQFALAMATAAEVKDQTDIVVGGADSVIAVHRAEVRIRASGRDASFNVAHVLTFRDGKLVRLREYADSAAWEAAFDEPAD